jgi:hypothetical protein
MYVLQRSTEMIGAISLASMTFGTVTVVSNGDFMQSPQLTFYCFGFACLKNASLTLDIPRGSALMPQFFYDKF